MINYFYIFCLFLFPVCYVSTIFLKDYKLKVLTKIKDKHFCKNDENSSLNLLYFLFILLFTYKMIGNFIFDNYYLRFLYYHSNINRIIIIIVSFVLGIIFSNRKIIGNYLVFNLRKSFRIILLAEELYVLLSVKINIYILLLCFFIHILLIIHYYIVFNKNKEKLNNKLFIGEFIFILVMLFISIFNVMYILINS